MLLYVGIFQRPPLNPCCLRMIPLPAFVTLAYFLCRFILTEKKDIMAAPLIRAEIMDEQVKGTAHQIYKI